MNVHTAGLVRSLLSLSVIIIVFLFKDINSYFIHMKWLLLISILIN